MENYNFTIYQLLLILISGFFLSRNITKFRKNVENRSLVRFILVTIFWFGVLIIMTFPNLARLISVRLGMGENFNTLIFTAFIITFIFMIKLLASLDNLEHDITELVREKALQDLSKSKKRKKTKK